MTRTIAAVVCVTGSAAGVACAQTVINGDFSLEVPRNGTGNGWTSSQIDGAGGWSGGGNPGTCFVLNDNGPLQTDPTLSQLITGLVPGLRYEITGDYASWHINSSPPGGRAFRVSMDGAEIFVGHTTAGHAWTPFSAPFIATAPSMLLRLAAEIDGTDNDCAVDNIAIVPAPAYGAVLLLAAAAARRRR